MVTRAEKQEEGIWGSGEPSSSLQWLDPELFREMSFLPLRAGGCALALFLSPALPHSHRSHVAFGKGKAGRSPAQAEQLQKQLSQMSEYFAQFSLAVFSL